MGLESESPITVSVRQFEVAKPGDTIEDVVMDGPARSALVKKMGATLRAKYVLPDVAERMAQAIEQRDAEHAYDAMTDPAALVKALMKDLRDVSHDKHLRADFSPIKQVKPAEAAGGAKAKADPAKKAEMERWLRGQNCGFTRVERLAGNVGYLKFDVFGVPDVCAATAKAAMAFVADTDAIVFDLRENHGGDPKLLVVLASYLFHDRTHVNDIYNRPENKTEEFWTDPSLPGKKSDRQPVYVLTSHETFSCGEELTYDLKALKRATIVGETTGGGAHPVDRARLDAHFSMIVPVARAINPITKTNWEGVGVEPDVKVPAKEALEKALEMARSAKK